MSAKVVKLKKTTRRPAAAPTSVVGSCAPSFFRHLKPRAVVFADDCGNEYTFAIEPIPKSRGGAARKVHRDMSVLLHFSFLTGPGGYGKTKALEKVAEIFDLYDASAASTIVRKASPYAGPGLFVWCMGVEIRPGVIDGRLMISLDSKDAIRRISAGRAVLEGRGFIAKWLDGEAQYGRVSARFNPLPGVDQLQQ